jgi:RimJ/RimL family protein N-acetyltransferase
MMPKFKIEGKRVNLRTTIAEDIADYERWNNPKLLTWQFDGPYHKHNLAGRIIQRRRWLKTDQAPPYTFLEIETVDRAHIGWVVFYFNVGLTTMPEIGINIVEDTYWNGGLGTEATLLWIDYLFQSRDFHRIGFSTWSGNLRMIAVGRKLGFVEEARIRRGCKVKGKYYDRIKMGILREDWQRLHTASE